MHCPKVMTVCLSQQLIYKRKIYVITMGHAGVLQVWHFQEDHVVEQEAAAAKTASEAADTKKAR